MNLRPSPFEVLVAKLARDPATAAMFRAEGRILAFDLGGAELLWASPAAADLAEAVTAPASGRRTVRSDLAAVLARLGGGGVPHDGVRLERLRLAEGRITPPLTCACRIATLPDLRDVLLVAPVGELPKNYLKARHLSLVSRPQPAAPETAPPAPEPAEPAPAPIAAAPEQAPVASAEEAEPAAMLPPAQDAKPVSIASPDEPDTAAETPRAEVPEAVARLSGLPRMRFLWQADSEARLTMISPELAEIVGAANIEILGRRFEEMGGSLIADPEGRVAAALARGETFGGETVFWRVGGSNYGVAVELAGMPVRGQGAASTGFRGFGRCLPERVEPGMFPEPWNPGADASDPPEQSVEAAPGPEQEAPVRAPPPGDEALRSERPVPEAAQVSPQPSEPEQAPAPEADAVAPNAEPQPEPVAAAPAPRPALFAVPTEAPETAASPTPEPAGPSTGERPQIAAPAAGEDEAARLREPMRLSGEERNAFREIARALGARYAGDEAEEAEAPPSPPPVRIRTLERRHDPGVVARLLDRMPFGVLIHRGDDLVFANRTLLDILGYDNQAELARAGGVESLFRGQALAPARLGDVAPFSLATKSEGVIPAEVRLTTVEWEGFPASFMMIRRIGENDPALRLKAIELDLRARDARLAELNSILDTAIDGLIILDHQGRILSLNRSAEALFGYDQNEVVGDPVMVLLAPESQTVARDYLEGLNATGVAGLLNDGREVIGRVRQGGTIPLSMTIGRINEGPERKYCAVLRDITQFKKAEGELLAAKRAAEEASAHKSEFLAKISYEVRTPLSAIIGFAEMMLEERFGPVNNERYRDYLRDIHASGERVVGLVDNLLDLAKVGAGRMELAFTSVQLTDIVQATVTEMQPLAVRGRIVLRTSLAAKLSPVVADERSVRQILRNIMSNAIKFTEAGGQVIVSTAVTDRGEVAVRIRDTGVGMNPDEVAAALEPFRQLNTTRKGSGTGLGLPLTKALVEANRGALRITSARDEGTLVEVLFPPTRVLAH